MLLFSLTETAWETSEAGQIPLDFWRDNSQDLQIGHLRQRYLWDETSSQGAAGVSSRWVVDQILAEETIDNGSDETVQWTLTDHLNTVRDIAKYDPDDDMTTVVNHLIYDAFGRVTSESNPAVDSLFLFTARPFDSDTGLQNNLNRWYDPAVGRWLSEDPIGFRGGMNLLRYVYNAPVLLVDPVGLEETIRGEDVIETIESVTTIKDLLAAVSDNDSIGSLVRICDASSELLGDQVSKFIKALNRFQPQTECGQWYKSAYLALVNAHKGDGRGCADIAAQMGSSHQTWGDKCAMSLLFGSGGTAAPNAFCQFSQQLAKKCSEIARRKKTEGGHIGRQAGVQTPYAYVEYLAARKPVDPIFRWPLRQVTGHFV